MKLTVILLTICIFHASGASFAQKISLQEKNATLSHVIKEIRTQSGFDFLVDSKLLDQAKPVTITLHSVSLETALIACLEDQDIVFKIENNIVMLKAKPGILYHAGSVFEINLINIKGKIVDVQGLPIPGATVKIKKNGKVVITNELGQFSLAGVDIGEVLIVSYVGYVSQEVKAVANQEIQIILKAQDNGLEELVVVGYGKQKKVNLTGSVATVGEKEIAKQTLTQASQALSGAASGVTVIQGSGQPGRDQGRILIRGMGTFSSAGNNPLVLVDGIASSMDDINPNDIKNISVLKDASSASIYGARAANGVILIETKQGEEGKTKINYTGYLGRQKPTSMIRLVESWKYAEFINEAATNEGRSKIYTDEEIEKFKSGVDPDNYPNANHYKDLVTSGSGVQTNHDLSFSGGKQFLNYHFSLGYLNQEGIVKEAAFEKISTRLNIDSKLHEKLNLKVRISGNQGDENEPVSAGSNPQKSLLGMITYGIKIPNTIAALKSDGTYGNSSGFTTAGWLASESFNRTKSNNFLGSVELEYNLLKSLKLSAKSGYMLNMLDGKMFGAELVVDNFYTEGPAQLTVRQDKNTLSTLQFLADYNLTFNDQAIHLLAGYSQEAARSSWSSAFRDNFPNNALYEINAGSQNNMRNGGSGNEWALQSFFGRLNYMLLDRYLFEANARYDGSSRFPKNKRFGMFPSFSAGWIISNEGFLKNKFSWISLLKLRASYGKLGNQEIGLYPYQQVLTTGLDYPIGMPETLLPGISATIIPNQDITWETTEVSNIGLDLSLFGGKLGIETEYFYKKTKDILYKVSTSKILGLLPSEQNAGKVENRGIDFSVKHNNNFGEFSYDVGLNFSYVRNKVLQLSGIERDLANGLLVGYPLQSFYGYEVDGLFVDQADIAAYPKQPYTAFPGEYRFKDLSGKDGVPDGIVDPEYDRKVIGSGLPKYTYGLNLNASYKGIDLSVQFRGLGGYERIMDGSEQGRALLLGSNVQDWMYENRWTAENPNREAIYPRALVLNVGSVHNWVSSYWLRDASFLRLSNLQLGYTLPKKIIPFMNRVRIYASARNLFSLDSYYPGWDPESGNNYPPTSVYTLGFNVNF